MTRDLLNLADWLTSKGCTHVAMESTGVYWKPIYNILELSQLEILVVNAKHIKAVPGRKTEKLVLQITLDVENRSLPDIPNRVKKRHKRVI